MINRVYDKLIKKLALPSNPEIEEIIDRLINGCFNNYTLINEVKKVDINTLKKDIEPSDNIWKRLEGCESVNIGLVSLGKLSEDYLNKTQNGDSFEFYLINEIYNILIEESFIQVWCNLKETLDEKMRLTGVIAAGEGDIKLELQKVIFKYVSHPEVTLNEETLLMTPLKSITFIIGEGKNIPIFNLEDRCRECNFAKCQTTITINGIKYQVSKGKRLYDVLVDNQIFFDSFCGGNHRCGKCLVEIIANGKRETKLACDTYCYSGLEVVTQSRMNDIKVQDQYLGEKHHKESIKTDNYYGIVFDIGTTTIVGGLYHLGTKEQVNIVSMPNEQYLFGLDVISRISYSLINDDGLERLNQSIIKQLNRIINELTIDGKDNVTKIVIVGNPTMISIINNLDLRSLASYPYQSQVSRFIKVKAEEIGLTTKASVTFISGVSSFIGSDVLCGVVASKFFNSDSYQLLIDLGTNGELALGNKNHIYACSSAAGPAFEGGRIGCGVPSIPGAISKFDITNGVFDYQTIANIFPIGFCGSGIIDLISTLIKNKYIDDKGVFIKDQNFDIKLNDNNFTLTQPDIREFQLAKSALFTGIEILFKKVNLTIDQLDTIFIGGGLGSNINIDSAITIGLLPIEAKNIEVKLIGNSAFYGASLYLLDEKYQEIFNKTKSLVKVIDLNEEDDFIDLFVSNLTLKLKKIM